MTGGNAYKQKFFTDDALDAAVSAYLADPSAPAVLEIRKARLDVNAAAMAYPQALAVLARLDSTLWQMRTVLKAAILLAPVC